MVKSELRIEVVELFGNKLLILDAFCEDDSVLVLTNSTKTVLDCFSIVSHYFSSEVATNLFAKLEQIEASWESDLPEIILTGVDAVLLAVKMRSLLELKSKKPADFRTVLESEINDGSFVALMLYAKLLVVFKNEDSEIRILFLTSSEQVEKQDEVDLFRSFSGARDILVDMVSDSLPQTSTIEPISLVGAPAFLIAKAIQYYSYQQIKSIESARKNPWAEKAHLN